MGALHTGHMKLVGAALSAADRTVVSIFVNPTQFAPGEDLERYPRDESGDLEKLEKAGVDVVWAPGAGDMYGQNFATAVVPEGAANGLETTFRPHFFRGVATVVTKLFNQVGPDIAVFGEKDYQQLCVVRQLVRDLDMPLEILGCETVREADGLALSSRNSYLGGRQRSIAPALYRVISQAAEAVNAGQLAGEVENGAVEALRQAGFDDVDYVAVRDGETLGSYDQGANRQGRVLAAAWLGKTRLIDNVGF